MDFFLATVLFLAVFAGFALLLGALKIIFQLVLSHRLHPRPLPLVNR